MTDCRVEAVITRHGWHYEIRVYRHYGRGIVCGSGTQPVPSAFTLEGAKRKAARLVQKESEGPKQRMPVAVVRPEPEPDTEPKVEHWRPTEANRHEWFLPPEPAKPPVNWPLSAQPTYSAGTSTPYPSEVTESHP